MIRPPVEAPSDFSAEAAERAAEVRRFIEKGRAGTEPPTSRIIVFALAGACALLCGAFALGAWWG